MVYRSQVVGHLLYTRTLASDVAQIGLLLGRGCIVSIDVQVIV